MCILGQTKCKKNKNMFTVSTTHDNYEGKTNLGEGAHENI